MRSWMCDVGRSLLSQAWKREADWFIQRELGCSEAIICGEKKVLITIAEFWK